MNFPPSTAILALLPFMVASLNPEDQGTLTDLQADQIVNGYLDHIWLCHSSTEKPVNGYCIGTDTIHSTRRTELESPAAPYSRSVRHAVSPRARRSPDAVIRYQATRGPVPASVLAKEEKLRYTAGDESDGSSYPETGITTSLLMIHPSFGYWWSKPGIRLTGIYLGKDRHEAHINLGYKLYDSDKVQHSINLLTSRVAGSDPGADYKYWATGIAYGIYYRGFFLEIGLAHPWKDDLGNLDDNPVIPGGYLGYIYRFKPQQGT